MSENKKRKIDDLPDLKFIETIIIETQNKRQVTPNDKIKYLYERFKQIKLKYKILTEDNEPLNPSEVIELITDINNELNTVYLKLFQHYQNKEFFFITTLYDDIDELYNIHQQQVKDCFVYLHLIKTRYSFYNKYPICSKIDELIRLFNYLIK